MYMAGAAGTEIVSFLRKVETGQFFEIAVDGDLKELAGLYLAEEGHDLGASGASHIHRSGIYRCDCLGWLLWVEKKTGMRKPPRTSSDSRERDRPQRQSEVSAGSQGECDDGL